MTAATTTSSIDDLTLAACQRADPAAFRRLVLAYQQVVLSLCTAMAGDDGEDLAQETFVRVHAAIRKFDPTGPASLRSWILVIARRLCVDRARRVRRRPQLVNVDDISIAAPHARPDRELTRARLAQDIRSIIEQLPVEQRVVLALREWEGIDYDEIAAIEGIPIGTVRSRLARARESIRAALTRDGHTPDEEDSCAIPTLL